ncbi:MAG: hypothetical protein MJZ86_00765 [Bacteroidales bacterium]|nr:hypothetical protein [Bacteroidales bacterium]
METELDNLKNNVTKKAIDAEKLADFVLKTSCPCQYGGELMEITDGRLSSESQELSNIIRRSKLVKWVTKEEVQDDFCDLVNWAQEDNDCFVFVKHDVLLCITVLDAINIIS